MGIDQSICTVKLRKERCVSHGGTLLGRGVRKKILVGIGRRGGRAATTAVTARTVSTRTAAGIAARCSARIDNGNVLPASRAASAARAAARTTRNSYARSIGAAGNVVGGRAALPRQIYLSLRIIEPRLLLTCARIPAVAILVMTICLGIRRERTDPIRLAGLRVTVTVCSDIPRRIEAQITLSQLKGDRAKYADRSNRNRRCHNARCSQRLGAIHIFSGMLNARGRIPRAF